MVFEGLKQPARSIAPIALLSCEDRPMKVGTPLGEYPFEFRAVERRGEGVAIIGRVAGMESSVVLEWADARLLARRLGPLLLAAALVVAVRRRPGR